MASDIFAKLGDIKGESLDDKHKDEIEVLSFSWGLTSPGTITGGGGGGAGKVSFQDLSFVHRVRNGHRLRQEQPDHRGGQHNADHRDDGKQADADPPDSAHGSNTTFPNCPEASSRCCAAAASASG